MDGSEESTALLVSVVIPACNEAGTIGECVEALQHQTLSRSCYEIIVVDDGSTDETPRIAEEAGARVLRQERRWPAAARNTGIKAAQGEIICFTDGDCVPRRDWLAQLTRPFCDPEIIGCKGVYDTRQPELMARFVQIEYEDKYDRLRSQRRIDFIDTYCAAYRRDVLLANNGFDEAIRYVEDQELSFRLAIRGYSMVFQPEAAVYHEHPSEVTEYFRKKFMIGFWKAQVVRRFPGRGIRDSHTPQILKVQLGLMALILGAAVGSLVFPSSWPILALLIVVFLATTLPFVRKAWGKDRAVAIVAPGILAIRGLALGFGYFWGTLRPRPGVSGTRTTIGGLNYVAKRALDIAGALLGLAVTTLLGPIIAMAIKLDSPGPVFYRQVRVGQGGRQFTMYKFRSMQHNADEELDNLISLEDLDEPVFKLQDDPRRTRFGRFLRRWSIDELPQFWNVLKGDMSLVGPRPEEVRLVHHYNDWHRKRLAIKPGLSGPMQVNGRGDLSLDERVRMELDYIDNYSFWRDLAIMARTIPAVLRGEGAR